MTAGNAAYDGPEDLPLDVPLFPLARVLLLPRSPLPLIIFEPRYLSMIDAALAGHRLIGIIQPRLDREPGQDEGTATLCEVGCLGRITSFSETGDGRYQVTLTGVVRFRIEDERPSGRLYRVARVSPAFAVDFEAQAGESEVDRSALLKAFAAYLDANGLEADWDNVQKTSTETLVNSLCMMSPYGAAEKQALLEAPDLKTRAETLIALTEIALARGRGKREPTTLN
ncbi:LON peptidase substrate-binding domain-containing protein [Oryzibacter oryziterrae]|uniref:LON peptidase substrate-binding domain-containing protein n=1 Tax=Oryzibacter oryziterrae TaxID=2766474 RepID=UPI001F44F84E|nr:LON peptidase substrate-binding domain-containing protein [Oryzibacter oryziterrae]